ncbi:MAG: LysM peptidoglycan-binding domain-containing protein, partial [Candidatus Coatesbacteria bacterium]|nr:LysM peptidoglycan-binding domain-containing protein [Candidatus Coatesbacteria bacterium]
WIAQQYGSSVEAIRRANGLKGSTIKPGQKLVIPILKSDKSNKE